MCSGNLSKFPLLDSIALIAIAMHAIFSKLRLECPYSLLEPPLNIVEMGQIIPQRLPYLWVVHVFPHGPQRCLCVDFTAPRRKRYICSPQLEGTCNAAVLGFQGSNEEVQGFGVFLQ